MGGAVFGFGPSSALEGMLGLGLVNGFEAPVCNSAPNSGSRMG